MSTDLFRMSAVEIRDQLRLREISPRDLILASIKRIEFCEPLINALPIQCFERALKFSDSAKLEGTTLGGIPLCIKDLTPVTEVAFTAGSLAFRNNIAKESDPLVERIEKNGGIVIGKSNVPEMGAGNSTFNDVFGPTRNPWNLEKNPGGSSGGSCAAVASGEVWLGHGTDLAGSLRNPAAFCGVVALRPSPGRTGSAAPYALFGTETVHGPIARNVSDTALFLDAMAGYDRYCPIGLEKPTYSFLDFLGKPQNSPWKIAYSRDMNGFGEVEPEVSLILSETISRLDGNGFFIEENFPRVPTLYDTYRVLRAVQWGLGPGSFPSRTQNFFKETLKENIKEAFSLQASQIFKATRERSNIYRAVVDFFADYDVIACPVIGQLPGPLEEEYPRELGGESLTSYVDWLKFSFLAVAAGLPAISIPVALSADGMPVALQLIGKPRGELELLQCAFAVEGVINFSCGPIDPIKK